MTLKGPVLGIKEIARVLAGKRLSSLEARKDAQLDLHFGDGAKLVIKAVGGGLSIDFAAEDGERTCPAGAWPTTRQREYLECITFGESHGAGA